MEYENFVNTLQYFKQIVMYSSILNLFKGGVNLVNNLNNSAFSYNSNFGKQLGQDILALRSFQAEVAKGKDVTVAMSNTMQSASVVAKKYAINNKITKSSIHDYVISQKQAQVANAAQSSSFKDQVSIIKAYNDNLHKTGLSQDQFREAVNSSNPTLGKYLNSVKAGEATVRGYVGSLVEAKIASVALKFATVALNIALTSAISMGLAAGFRLISDAINATKKSIEDASDSISELKESFKTLDDYKDKIIELRTALDKGGLSIGDVTTKREELFEIQKQLIDKYGDEARGIDFVTGSLEKQIAVYDELKNKKTESWLYDNSKGIQNAYNFLYADQPDSGRNYLILNPRKDGYTATGTPTNPTGVSKFLSDWIENTPNVAQEWEGAHQAGIRFTGNRMEIIEAYDKLLDDLKEYKDTQEGLTEQDKQNIEALKIAISSAKKYITDNDSYDKSVQTYTQATEYVAQTESVYKKFYDDISKYQKEYDDAVIQGNEDVAKDAYVKVQNAYKNLFDSADFSQTLDGVHGEDVRKWFEEQQKNFENLSVPIRLKVDIEGTKREFDLSYEKLADMYAKVGDEGFVIKSDWRGIPAVDGFNDVSVAQASEFNDIRDAAKAAGVSIESYIDALAQYGKIRKETSATTEELSITKYAESIKTAQDAISPLLDAYNKLQKGEMNSVDIVSLISDKFPSLIKYTDNLSLGIQKLASAKLDEIKKSLEEIDKDKLSEDDLKAYEKFIEYIDNINDKFHSNLAYLEKIQTNSKNVMDVITTLISLKNEINKYESLSESSIDKVMSNESLILLRPYLNDVKSMMPIINDLISEQKQAYEDLYNEQQRLIDSDAYIEASQQKQKEDESAFQNSLKRINDQVEKFKEKYGVDLSNWDKINDGKKEILKNTNAELLSKQLKLINDFSNYYNIDLKNFKDTTEAKAAILKNFRDSEALAQASQIAVEKGWLHNYQGQVLLDGAEAIKEISNVLQPLGLTVDDFTQYLTNGYFSATTDKRLTEQLNQILNTYTITPATWDEMLKDSGGSGSGSAASKRKTWFEQQYDDHNHLVKMEKETEKNYLDWLDNAYKQAYSQGIIDLDAYYKYEEEVYNGRKKLTGEGTYWFEKEYKEHQHRLKMETEDEETYLKWLDQAYKRAYSEGRITLDDYRKYEEEVYTGLKKLFEKQYQLHQHYLKMETEDEADYLKWLNEAYKQAYRQGFLSLEDYRKYQEEVYEGVKKLKDNAESAIKSLIDIRINMLKEDVNKEKEAIDKKLNYLKDFYQKQKDMLQDKYDEEKYLDEQAEKRKKVSDVQAQIEALRMDESAKAQKRRVELTKDLQEAQKDLTDFEKEHTFNEAKDQLDKLYENQEKVLNKQTEALDKKLSSPQELYEQALNDIRNGSQNLYGQMIEWNNLYGDGIRDTIKKAWEEAYKAEKQYFNYTGTHFNGVNLSNATGYVKGVSGYASGTSHAIAGIHKVDEQGVETIFQSADGQRYRMFSSGEKVLNASASDFLYKFANKGREILDKLFNGTSHSYNNVVPGVVANNIQLGDIVIQGNADKSTVSEIRRAQRENLEQMLKQLNRLK